MNITEKIIITDTNIITDLYIADLLEKFIKLDNVYITDLILKDEINNKTCNIKLKRKFKIILANTNQIIEASDLSFRNRKLSFYDSLNFILARDNHCILATGDSRLKKFSEEKGIEVIRTLKIIELMYNHNIINLNESKKACYRLKEAPDTRIPDIYIDELLNSLGKSKIEV